MKYAILGLAFALAACGPATNKGGGDGGADDDGGPNGQPHDLVAITITPTNPIVELDLNMPARKRSLPPGSTPTVSRRTSPTGSRGR